MIRRRVQMFLLVAFCWKVGFSQSTAEDASNISCVARIQLPTYPPLAKQARIQGAVKVSVQFPLTIRIEDTDHRDVLIRIRRTASRGAHVAPRASVESPVVGIVSEQVGARNFGEGF